MKLPEFIHPAIRRCYEHLRVAFGIGSDKRRVVPTGAKEPCLDSTDECTTWVTRPFFPGVSPPHHLRTVACGRRGGLSSVADLRRA